MRSPPPTPLPVPSESSLVGPPHAFSCRHPADISWVQAARKFIPSAVLALVGILVTLSLSLGAQCRAAGAADERIMTLQNRADVNRDGIKNLDAQQRSSYEKEVDVLLRIEGSLKAIDERLEAQQRQLDRLESARRAALR